MSIIYLSIYLSISTKPKLAKILLKDKVNGFALSDINTCHKAIFIYSVYSATKDKPLEQLFRNKLLRMYMLYNKDGTTEQWRKDDPFNK
jgi:hypothetical protein